MKKNDITILIISFLIIGAWASLPYLNVGSVFYNILFPMGFISLFLILKILGPILITTMASMIGLMILIILCGALMALISPIFAGISTGTLIIIVLLFKIAHDIENQKSKNN